MTAPIGTMSPVAKSDPGTVGAVRGQAQEKSPPMRSKPYSTLACAQRERIVLRAPEERQRAARA